LRKEAEKQVTAAEMPQSVLEATERAGEIYNQTGAIVVRITKEGDLTDHYGPVTAL